MYEYRIDIQISGGTETLLADQIFSCNIKRSLFEDFGIGNACSSEMNCELLNPTDPVKGGMVRPYIREVGSSTWTPKGIFYIYEREWDDSKTTLRLHCFDAMIKAETEFFTSGSIGTWPRLMSTVASQVASIMGASIDSRTSFNGSYYTQYQSNDITCRELLAEIAAAHGGNWMMTDEGKLLLVPLFSIPTETYYIVDEDGNPLVFGTDTRILWK